MQTETSNVNKRLSISYVYKQKVNKMQYLPENYGKLVVDDSGASIR